MRRAAWRRPASWVAALWLLGILVQPPASLAWDSSRLRRAATALGPGALAELPALERLLAETPAQDELHRLVSVNRFFNQRIQFRDDPDVWGTADYWASPLETLARGRGDCEDFVIAKYAVLLAAQVPLERLRLVYVRATLPDRTAPIAHMVLAYYPAPGAVPLILDNLRPEVQPASERTDLAPVFSFNSAGLWQGAGSRSAGDPMARLSPWRDAWQRTRDQGFP